MYIETAVENKCQQTAVRDWFRSLKCLEWFNEHAFRRATAQVTFVFIQDIVEFVRLE